MNDELSGTVVSGSRLLERLFLLFLIISQIYYAFRYALQYNSTTTSPTYSNTPFAFQFGKYAIAILIFAVSSVALGAARGRSHSVNRKTLYILVFLSGFACYSIALGVTFTHGSLHSIGRVSIFHEFFYFPLLLLLPFHFNGWQSLRKYFRILIVFGCTYHIIYSAIQVAAFVLYRRLPALGYPGGLVRFGGGWDDPNGFGAYLVLPILFLLSDAFFSKKIRFLLTPALFALLALTVSLSAAAAMIGALLCYTVLKRKWVLLIITASLLATLLSIPLVHELLLFAYQHKKQSMDAHLDTMSLTGYLLHATPLEFLFGRHTGSISQNESYYYATTVNYGVVALIWFLTIVGLTIWNAIVKSNSCQSSGDYQAAELFRILASFIAALSVTSLGIAYYYSFPVGFYLWFAIFVVWLADGRIPPHKTYISKSETVTGRTGTSPDTCLSP